MNTACFCNSRATSRLLVAVLGLQALTVLGQWTAQPSLVAPAHAGVPTSADPSAQRQQIVDELRNVNSKLDKLVTLLDSGKLQVTTGSDK